MNQNKLCECDYQGAGPIIGSTYYCGGCNMEKPSQEKLGTFIVEEGDVLDEVISEIDK